MRFSARPRAISEVKKLDMRKVDFELLLPDQATGIFQTGNADFRCQAEGVVQMVQIAMTVRLLWGEGVPDVHNGDSASLAALQGSQSREKLHVFAAPADEGLVVPTDFFVSAFADRQRHGRVLNHELNPLRDDERSCRNQAMAVGFVEIEDESCEAHGV